MLYSTRDRERESAINYASFIQVDQEDANTLATVCTVESQLKATNTIQGKREEQEEAE
jgi:hypothetical protein